MSDPILVDPKRRVRLRAIDPDDTRGLDTKE
jgi:hypothetical protein